MRVGACIVVAGPVGEEGAVRTGGIERCDMTAHVRVGIASPASLPPKRQPVLLHLCQPLPACRLYEPPQPLSDEAKAQKLQELREQLQKEEEARQQRKQQQPQASEASAAAKDDSDSDSDDDAADEGEGEGEQEAEVEQAAAPPRRRPGLRRGAGGLRLGRKRV